MKNFNIPTKVVKKTTHFICKYLNIHTRNEFQTFTQLTVFKLTISLGGTLYLNNSNVFKL